MAVSPLAGSSPGSFSQASPETAKSSVSSAAASPALSTTRGGVPTSSKSNNTSTGPIGLGLGVVAADLDDGKAADVTSPLELTQFVDDLLNNLESRFDAMSTDILSRLSTLSIRVDSLENSIGDLMSGSDSVPRPAAGLLVRSESNKSVDGDK